MQTPIISISLRDPPYAAHGTIVDGCLTRLASVSLINVTAGGGSQTPTFLAEPR
jgi:hypothetical protein